MGSDHEYSRLRDLATSSPGGRIPTCSSNGSTRASETAATMPCRSLSTSAPAMALPSWSPTRLSHSNDDGCGLGANCNSTNPYNRKVDYGTSDLNQKQAFSAAFTLQSPFDQVFQQVGLQSGWRMGAQWHCPDRFGVAFHRNHQRRPGKRRLYQPGTRERGRQPEHWAGSPHSGAMVQCECLRVAADGVHVWQ